jgi:hypothetical protein
MSETEHEPEQEVEALQDQSDRLGEDISDAREDWESKKADDAVPGAGGSPVAAQSDHANEQFPAVGDAGEATEDLAEAPLDPQDPANEDL